MSHPIQDLLNEVNQPVTNTKVMNRKYGCDKILDYSKRRVCQITGRLKLLRLKFKQCPNDECRKMVASQLKKWHKKRSSEMVKKKRFEKPETYSMS